MKNCPLAPAPSVANKEGDADFDTKQIARNLTPDSKAKAPEKAA